MCDRRPSPAKVLLGALTAQLRKSSEASARLYGGTTYHAEELALFKSIARKENLFLEDPPPELALSPTAEGNEHQVWFRKERASLLKATWPKHLGMRVVHRMDEEPQASPIDYLERGQLHNELFGDDVHFLGALETTEGLRLSIEQPAIEGSPATLAEIQSSFGSSAWHPFHLEGNLAFFDPEQYLAVSDTHLGNIIAMLDGQLAPIDHRVQHFLPSLVDNVRTLS